MADPKFTAGTLTLTAWNRNVAALPAMRVVAGGNPVNPGEVAVDTVLASGVSRGIGIIPNAIQPGASGDLTIQGVEPVQSDGTAIINVGDKLTYDTVGRVKTANPAAGVNQHIIGIAVTKALATLDAVVHCAINPSVMQG